MQTRAGAATASSNRPAGTPGKDEKGPLILYVEWRQRRAARDGQDNPVLDEASRPKLEWSQRDRPLVTLHVCHVGPTEGLKLRSLQTAPPEWEGHGASRG